MGKKGCRVSPVMVVFFLVALLFMSGFSGTVAFQQMPAESSMLKTYIVHVNEPEDKVSAEPSKDLESWYRSFLPASTESMDREQGLVYSYRHVLRGFAARLTEEEVKAMEKKDGFVSATPEKIYQLHTTNTPAFLGLHNRSGFWKGSNYGEGVIIGVLDTGVYPEHPSFNDDGMPAPPAKWKGTCKFNGTLCNNKLIGARSFESQSLNKAPVDDEGHGTHTASTAAGNYVKQADLYGIVKGTAAGIAPRAHLAVYKICGPVGCAGGDILAAFDAAIEDGVDVISLSVGGESSPFYNDPIALGAFAAFKKGIFVSCSAGNSGPAASSVANEAPWILTVAASTHYRKIVATAILGNKEEFVGESLYQPRNFSSKLLPLVYAGANGDPFCGPGSLKNSNVKGKVVLCDRGGGVDRTAKGAEVKRAGGAAMIHVNSINDGYSILADPHVLPATHLSYADGLKIKSYIKSTSKPTATILFKGARIGYKLAPEITSFSSRGPSLATPGILKPDITGPGVSIVAAWPAPLLNVTRSTKTFNMISGTSMSCPHLSGVAALLKSSHPKWSPAAIKSAIMTTALTKNLKNQPILDEKHHPADFFAVGAGHVNPSKASDPGLVYDIEPNDYIPYLCGLGYSDAQVGGIISRKVNCSKESSIPEAELNYPSFSVALGSKKLKFKRIVTNVGKADSYYTVLIYPPKGVVVAVKPSKIHFTKLYEKKSYTVSFTKAASKYSKKGYAQGFLKWVSSTATYSVRSPISVTFE